MSGAKLLSVSVLTFGLAIGHFAFAAGTDVTLSSPNGFPIAGIDGVTVNCTYFVDGMAQTPTWRLKFNGRPGNAKTWATQVTNVNKSFVPSAGSIMVLDAFSESPEGHVGWVTSWQKNKDGSFTITVKEGFARGTPYGKVNGKWNYYLHTWTVSSGSAPTAQVSGGKIKIKVLGFLTRK